MNGSLGIQIRMARAALNWTAAELAERSSVAVNTIRRIEAGETFMSDTAEKLTSTLQSAGVHFLVSDEHGTGIRFKQDSSS